MAPIVNVISLFSPYMKLRVNKLERFCPCIALSDVYCGLYYKHLSERIFIEFDRTSLQNIIEHFFNFN
jgi:hypothetical protein